MARTKLTQEYKDAMHEIRRLEKAARRVEKRGFTFNLPFRYTESGLRREYTIQDVEELKSMRTKDLYKYAEYVTEEGEVLTGEQGRKYERSRAAKKGIRDAKYYREFVSSTIVDDFLDFSQYPHFSNQLGDLVKEYITQKISIYGENAVAFILQMAYNLGDEGGFTAVQQSYYETVRFALLKLDKIFDKYGMEYKSWLRDYYGANTDIIESEDDEMNDWTDIDDDISSMFNW